MKGVSCVLVYRRGPLLQLSYQLTRWETTIEENNGEDERGVFYELLVFNFCEKREGPRERSIVLVYSKRNQPLYYRRTTIISLCLEKRSL